MKKVKEKSGNVAGKGETKTAAAGKRGQGALARGRRPALDVRLKERPAPDVRDQRYIDFRVPKTGLPCIAMEWLLGARGIRTGEILQVRVSKGRGEHKSAFMFLQYAAGQAQANAHALHVVTGRADPQINYDLYFGCKPGTPKIIREPSFDGCFDSIAEAVAGIRGRKSGKADGPADPGDSGLMAPVIVGVEPTGAPSGDESLMRERALKLDGLLKRRKRWLRDTRTFLMLASEGTGGGQSSPLQDAIGRHAAYDIAVSESRCQPQERKYLFGFDTLTLTNRMPHAERRIDIQLIWYRGPNLVKTDWEFLSGNPASPFASKPGEGRKLYMRGDGIICKALRRRPFKCEEDFLRAFYGNEDLCMGVREKLRIRGFGFDADENVKA